MGVSNSQSQVFSSFQLSQFTFLIWTLYLHTPSFFLLLLAFQPHLQTPKWFWQLQECTNATARTFGVINNRVYYCRFGKSFKCWGTFPVAMPCVAARAVTVVKCQLQYLWTLMSKKKRKRKRKAYHSESWPHTDYLLLLNSSQKSLWTVLFWQLNVAKLLSSFLCLFPWGGRGRKCRYFQVVWSIKGAINPFLYIYIKCNKEQKGEGRMG